MLMVMISFSVLCDGFRTFYYNFRENGIARKNREFVDNLPYDEEVKGMLQRR